MSRAWRYWRTVDAPPPIWISRSPAACPGATERFLNSARDEMKDGPAFHRDRLARVVRQHEHRRMIGRILPPPAAPLVVGPRPAHGAEHVSAHDIRPDAFPEALGKIVVGTRRPPVFPLISRNPRVPTYQPCSSSPPTPSGSFSPWRGPAP